MTALPDVADLVYGCPFPSSGFRNGIDPNGLPVVRIRDVVPGFSNTSFVGSYDSTYVVEDGDMLIGMDGEFNLARWRGGRALLNQRVCKVVPRVGKVEERYLFWALPRHLKAIEARTPFVTVKHLSAKALAAIELELPPRSEQRRIADILDKADAIRRKRKEAIALTEGLLRSAFLDMFGDPVTNPKGWPVKPFGELVREAQLGLVRAAAEQGDDRAHPYIRMNAIRSDGHMDLSHLTRVDATDTEVESCKLRNGDFLFNTRNSRELVGKAAVYHGDGTHLFNNNILRVRFCPGIESDFVSAYWQTSAGQQHLEARKAGTTSVFAIYYKSLATLPVPVPPASVQSKYAALCAAARKRLHACAAYREGADHLFNSLVTRAFSGTLESSR